ncbi:MAG: hypothetical protein SAK29_29440 [Scytonema sp. PMC 1069.18]|nr:hypothetical protein [Scytonema sp. PMC 1069.18]
MRKLLLCIAFYGLFVLGLNACSGPTVTEQHQTTEIEQYSSDRGGEQQQCNRSVVIQKNGKTEVYQSSKC